MNVYGTNLVTIFDVITDFHFHVSPLLSITDHIYKVNAFVVFLSMLHNNYITRGPLSVNCNPLPPPPFSSLSIPICSLFLSLRACAAFASRGKKSRERTSEARKHLHHLPRHSCLTGRLALLSELVRFVLFFKYFYYFFIRKIKLCII